MWYPPSYYNHFIEHPILWSEDRRRWEERKLAHECYSVWKTQERLKQREKLRNQSEYREMGWNPFGQPGNGAPNVDTRIRNLEMDELYPVNKSVPRQFSTLPRATKKSKYYCPGMTGVSGGSGAPIRNESGRMLLPLREDPSITFGESTRNYVDKDLRYRTTATEKNAYRQELDRMIEDKKRQSYNERFDNGNQMEPNPWGRPGPGGAPWRDPKNVGQNFLKSMGWTTKETLRNINTEINDRNLQPKLSPNYKKRPMACCDRCSCECIKKIENTILRSTSPPKAKENYRTDNDEPYFKSPKKLPHYAMPMQCNRQQDQTTQPSSRPTPKISPVKRTSKTSLVSGGVELVPLLAKRRDDDRPISLSTTDITKYKINKSSWQDGDPGIYLTDLDRQIMQKNRMRQMSRERDEETSRSHFQNFDSYWGRPGCGAPQQNKNKQRLDDLLYNAPMYEHY